MARLRDPRAPLVAAVLLVVTGVAAPAQLLHDALGPFERGEVRPYEPDDPEVLKEFGLELAEEAEYRTADGQSALLRALEFYDDTGAYSAFVWLRPPLGAEAERGERAVESGDEILIHFANYVLMVKGDWPDEEDIEIGLAYLPRPKPTADPPVLQHVPAEVLVPGTDRHILGPLALERLAPGLPPSTVGFHFGTEGHFGRYRTDAGEFEMLIWDYPSNPIARGQVEEFWTVEGAVAKHDGPLIAVVMDPASPDGAQRLLARVRYRAEVTRHVEPPERYDNLGNIILDTFILCGFLVMMMVIGGVLVAVTRRAAGRLAPESILAPPQGLPMQTLELDGQDQERSDGRH